MMLLLLYYSFKKLVLKIKKHSNIIQPETWTKLSKKPKLKGNSRTPNLSQAFFSTSIRMGKIWN